MRYALAAVLFLLTAQAAWADVSSGAVKVGRIAAHAYFSSSTDTYQWRDWDWDASPYTVSWSMSGARYEIISVSSMGVVSIAPGCTHKQALEIWALGMARHYDKIKNCVKKPKEPGSAK